MSGKGLHIVLIGFMGSGKSTIGKLLAHHQNIPYIDIDQEVIKREGKSISKIFEQEGESYFREIESEILLSSLLSKVPSVIATGGGAPCFLDGMERILSHSFSFYLKVGRATLLRRIEGDKTRPLANHKTKSELKRFIDFTMRERELYYAQADKTILAFDKPKKIVKRILRYLDKEKL